ncbi:MAG: Flp family type IVb pilin [Polaromonas sp.]|jgi:pilus assembly protein Flp/PilA|nr:Flp family type IVb pilin [Polaromonas sp.]
MKTYFNALSCNRHLSHFGQRQQGVTMIEYALIAALIAVVLVVILTALGVELGVTFTTIKNALTTANQ